MEFSAGEDGQEAEGGADEEGDEEGEEEGCRVEGGERGSHSGRRRWGIVVDEVWRWEEWIWFMWYQTQWLGLVVWCGIAIM